MSSRTLPSALVNDLRFAISPCFPHIRFAKTDDANPVALRNVAQKMKPLVEIPDSDASDLTPANFCVEYRCFKIEINLHDRTGAPRSRMLRSFLAGSYVIATLYCICNLVGVKQIIPNSFEILGLNPDMAVTPEKEPKRRLSTTHGSRWYPAREESTRRPSLEFHDNLPARCSANASAACDCRSLYGLVTEIVPIFLRPR